MSPLTPRTARVQRRKSPMGGPRGPESSIQRPSPRRAPVPGLTELFVADLSRSGATAYGLPGRGRSAYLPALDLLPGHVHPAPARARSAPAPEDRWS